MPTIDDKVVAMSFESSKFESGVTKTISALDKLKGSLKGMEGEKAFTNLDRASKQVQLGHIASGVDSIRQKLGLLSVAALAVFAQIAQRAVAAGAQLVKSLTIEPLIAGFREYTVNLNSIQTILGNTKASGADLQDVNATLQELNRYSDKTIYNFAEMARNIGTFTAAGVGLKPATAAIKGIANLAALSGSNSQQASTAMYQLSQAIAAGRVSLMDWNSVVNAGMGGTVFQRALAQTAVTMGELKESSLKLVGPMKNVSINGQSFRQSMMAAPGKQSWLTSDVLTKTLAQFTGDMKDADLAAQGFSATQIKAIQGQAKMAMQAATQVKTLTQVIDVAKETAGSGWAQTWQIIFGDFGEAKTTFTALSNALNGFINASAQARNKVLGDWKKFGGRLVLIQGIKEMFQSLGAILKPIKEAFRDIFPAKTGQDLFNLTVRFREFVQSIKPSAETIKNLHRTFAGIFAVMDIGKQIIGGILRVFARLFGILIGGSSSFLEITAGVGDFFVALDKALRKGKGLETFFSGLTSVLAIPIKLFQKITEAIANMFSGFSPGGFSIQMDGATKAAEPFRRVLEVISQALEGLGPAISKAVSGMNFQGILSVINTGLFAAIVLMLRKFIGGTTLERVLGLFGSKMGKSLFKNIGGGLLKNLSGAFGGLTGSLKAMQTSLKAKTLRDIAIAVALLAASVVALSFVDPEKVTASLGAMGIMMGELIGAMMLLGKVKGIKIPIIAASLIMLATAIDLLTISVIAMAKLSWGELTRGLGGIAVLLGTLSAASVVLSKNAGGMIRAGIAIGIIATALNVMALAVKQFGSMDFGSLAKGLAGVAGSLGIIAGAMKVMPRNMVMQSAALIVVATALNILVQAVSKFGAMNLTVIGKGLLGIGGGLIVIAAAMHLMPKSMVLTSTGLLLVAASLGKVIDAVNRMGGMSISKLAKGLVGLAGALVILAAGLKAMTGSMGGAVALTVAAAGLSLLSSALISLGKQSWGSIIKGMVALAAGIGLVAGASLLLGSAIPAMIGFGAALVLIGGGLALAGAGIALIGVGLSAIAVAGPTAIGILINALIDLTEAIPRMAKNLVLGLLSIVNAFAQTAPQFVTGIVKIIASLLDAIIKSAPKMAAAFTALLLAGLKALTSNAPKIIQGGFNLLMELLKGINNNIARVVTMGVKIVVTFLGAVASKIGTIIAAGANIIIKLIQGIGKQATNIVSAGAKAIAQFIVGIGNAAGSIVTAGVNTAIKFVNNLINQMIKMAKAMAQGIVKLLNATADIIDTYLPQIIAATARIGLAIVTGLVKGVGSASSIFYDKILELAKKAWEKLKHFWELFSPSHLTTRLGEGIVMGLVVGLDKSAPDVYASATAMSQGLIDTFNNVLQTASPSKVMMQIGKYVGQGFAQGLVSSQQNINTAFSTLNQKLTQAMSTARQTIISEQKKLKELRDADKPDAKAIAEAQKIIAQNQTILARSTEAHKLLTGALSGAKSELLGLAKEYEKVGTKLQAAQDILAQAIQTRDEAIKGYSEQYSELPSLEDPTDPNALATYQTALQSQITAVQNYASTLEQLRALGLDDTTYKKLLEEGPIDQQFANQLLAGGETAIQGLNALDAQLATESKKLGASAGTNLYQAGVDAAQGMVNGLKSQQTEIYNEMKQIAHAMVKALKKELKIKSPSEEFAKLGRFSMEGMSKGLANAAQNVIANAKQVGEDTLSALRKSMRGASNLIAEELNANATITPILDLTQARDQAAKLSQLVSANPITAQVSLSQANAISTQRESSSIEATAETPSGASFKFEQNNYSPKALSEIEIYRQTRNQLSQLKSIVVPA